MRSPRIDIAMPACSSVPIQGCLFDLGSGAADQPAGPRSRGSCCSDVARWATWSKRPEEGRDYPSLDDPSFNAPIYAKPFDDEGGERYTLLWSRPRKNGV